MRHRGSGDGTAEVEVRHWPRRSGWEGAAPSSTRPEAKRRRLRGRCWRGKPARERRPARRREALRRLRAESTCACRRGARAARRGCDCWPPPPALPRACTTRRCWARLPSRARRELLLDLGRHGERTARGEQLRVVQEELRVARRRAAAAELAAARGGAIGATVPRGVSVGSWTRHEHAGAQHLAHAFLMPSRRRRRSSRSPSCAARRVWRRPARRAGSSICVSSARMSSEGRVGEVSSARCVVIAASDALLPSSVPRAATASRARRSPPAPRRRARAR